MSPLFVALGVGLDILFAAIDLLLLTRAAGEEDQTLAVGLQAGDVGGEGFNREVGTAGVNADADGGGEFAGDAGFL